MTRPRTGDVKGARPLSALGDSAVAYAVAGWAVFPLAPASKVPLLGCPINRAYRQARESQRCPGGCGNDGHGVLDASTDPQKVAAWWRRHPEANIGARVPDELFVLDIDPRGDGDEALRALEAAHGPLPDTLTCWSGRGDGGRHLYFLNPGGRLVGRIGVGLDIKTPKGLVVLPPSLHGSTRRPYRWQEQPERPVAAPGWLAELVRRRDPIAVKPSTRAHYDGDSIVEWFNARHEWGEILVGWVPVGDGWRHPNATSALSATVRGDSLYVYSTSTPFEPTTPEDPRGYSKFRAWALLRHDGDMSAAARAARDLRHGTRTVL